MSATQPGRGRRALALAGLGATLLALGFVSAPREALLERGVARIIAADLERTLESRADATPSLFGQAARLAAAGEPVSGAVARLRVEGVETAQPGIERAVEAQWNLHREKRPGTLPPLRFGAEPGADDLELRLVVTAPDDRVEVKAELARGGDPVRVSLGERWLLPGPSSLLPPLLAVGVALVFGRTLLALFVGIWVGATILTGHDWGWVAPVAGLRDVFAVYLRRELVDSFRLEILGFIVALVALVGVVGRGGGLRGLVDRALRVVRGPRSAQALTSGLGLLLFFDDYANCVLVGNSMRPLTDRLRISREKLAYLVDSTAAPVAALSILSTWIAFQVSVYSPQLPAVGIGVGGYALFVEALPLRFYCIFALLLVFGVALSGRDFGPMARAEARARLRGELVRPGRRLLVDASVSRIAPAPGIVPDWRVAALPLGMTVLVTGWRIFADGGGFEAGRIGSLEDVGRILLAGSGSGPIFGGALAGLACAVFLVAGAAVRWGLVAGGIAALVQSGGPWLGALAFLGIGGFAAAIAARRAPQRSAPHLGAWEILRAGVASSRTLGFAFVLLLEAWMIGAVCQDLGTADFLVALLGDTLPPGWLPLLLFALAGVVAFSTGSSWSTMSILLPNVVALAAALGESSPLGVQGMVALCISAVLEGAIFGDHCSPISDTTVLSSVASGSDHLDHVRTQAPYALVAAGVAVAFGYLPLLWWPSLSPAVSFAAGGLALLAVLYGVGRPAPSGPLSGGGGTEEPIR